MVYCATEKQAVTEQRECLKSRIAAADNSLTALRASWRRCCAIVAALSLNLMVRLTLNTIVRRQAEVVEGRMHDTVVAPKIYRSRDGDKATSSRPSVKSTYLLSYHLCAG